MQVQNFSSLNQNVNLNQKPKQPAFGKIGKKSAESLLPKEQRIPNFESLMNKLLDKTKFNDNGPTITERFINTIRYKERKKNVIPKNNNAKFSDENFKYKGSITLGNSLRTTNPSEHNPFSARIKIPTLFGSIKTTVVEKRGTYLALSKPPLMSKSKAQSKINKFVDTLYKWAYSHDKAQTLYTTTKPIKKHTVSLPQRNLKIKVNTKPSTDTKVINIAPPMTAG